MFISFSKMLGKVGGFRIGARIRITKNNVLWASLVLACVYIGQIMWYSMLFAAWLMYAFFYGMYWVFLKIFKAAASFISTRAHKLQ